MRGKSRPSRNITDVINFCTARQSTFQTPNRLADELAPPPSKRPREMARQAEPGPSWQEDLASGDEGDADVDLGEFFADLCEKHADAADKGAVANRLSSHKGFWFDNLALNPQIRLTLDRGYSIPFLRIPPKFCIPNNLSAKRHSDFVTSEVNHLLLKGIIEEAKFEVEGINALSVAVQSSGKKRLILDCSFLNSHLATFKFKLETLPRVISMLQKRMFMVNLDLKSGYHHVPMRKDHWTYLGFMWAGKTYFYKVLPFGLSSGPFIFTKLFRPLMARWRDMGIMVFIYLDDILIAAHDEVTAKRFLVKLSKICGIQVLLSILKNVFSNQPVSSKFWDLSLIQKSFL